MQDEDIRNDEYKKEADRIAVITIIANTLLALFKLAAGIFAKSDAMVSDAIHSASDVFSTFIVMIGIRLATKGSDKEHPYGHERLECVAAIILSVILLLTGAGIAYQAVQKIVSGSIDGLEAPGLLALIAAIVSILTKEAMYHYTAYSAKKMDSSALMASAWHHRSDALSSIGALIGIAGARLGFPLMDPIASFIIFLFIAKAAYDIFRDAIGKMVDRSAGEETENELRGRILGNKDVAGISLLRTRMFGSRIYADIEILVDASRTLGEAHDIAEAVHDDIEQNFPAIKHIMVHVNPAGPHETTNGAE